MLPSKYYLKNDLCVKKYLWNKLKKSYSQEKYIIQITKKDYPKKVDIKM